MKSQLLKFVSNYVVKDRRVIQLIFLILSIILFVLGAGAPDASGGVGISGVRALGG